ncbi:MAG: glycine/sarcosine/betaine reductase complex component C subunit alpha [Oscillospiraceae bacterium]|nr:glycine/sarcosine/betaine reductase complex component C subunit alpha [Oscillospiraceae bacterium]
MSSNLEQVIARTFLDIADGLETGSFGSRPRIAVTGLGSEHGEEEVFSAALAASRKGVDVTYIGTMEDPSVHTVQAETEEQAHQMMESLLAEKQVDGVVTMHYPFPIGVSTVGRLVTPGRGRELFLATTTGTSSTDRVEGMIKNAVYGIIAAKACGIKRPTVGILNVDGARQTETALKQLQAGGYEIDFAESARSDGGCVMRGNDLLAASCDVMVTDSLTGNILMKTLSAFTTGGSYESAGYGYGPGIGEGYDRLVLIVSRASGAPVIANAIQFGAQLVQNGYRAVADAEFGAAKRAGLDQILQSRRAAKEAGAAQTQTISAPPKEVVTQAFTGIDVMDLEDAVQHLWKAGIYAESGMGCTGPMVMVNEANGEKAAQLLKEGGWLSSL